MEDLESDTPCSSIAVESILRIGTAGALWGFCAGPYDANKLGLTGLARASFVARSVGNMSVQCGSNYRGLRYLLTLLEKGFDHGR